MQELYVLQLLISGLSNKIIADKLFISVNTVKTHITNIFRKLHAKNRMDASIIAAREGLINLHEEE